jgi:hypothetical protein
MKLAKSSRAVLWSLRPRRPTAIKPTVAKHPKDKHSQYNVVLTPTDALEVEDAEEEGADSARRESLPLEAETQRAAAGEFATARSQILGKRSRLDMGHPDIAIHEDAEDIFHDARNSQKLRSHEMDQAHYDEEDESIAGSCSEDSEESEDEVDESVVEDMRKLEESFTGISEKYRLINRIGEGKFVGLSQPCRY